MNTLIFLAADFPREYLSDLPYPMEQVEANSLTVDYLLKTWSAILDDQKISNVLVGLPVNKADAFLAAVLTVLLRLDRLDVGVIPWYRRATLGSNIHGIKPLARVEKSLITAKVKQASLVSSFQSIPLVRDEFAYALVGEARILPAITTDKAIVRGESYVDEKRLFRGNMPQIIIRPLGAAPGLKAAVAKRFFKKWLTGRAIQTGAEKLSLLRDEIYDPHIRPKSAFYVHNKPWRLGRLT